MATVMLATEGPVDEVVLTELLVGLLGVAHDDVTSKRFPARGIQSLTRLLPDVIAAAHWAGHHLLIVHADIDDSPSHEDAHVEPDCRRCQLEAIVAAKMLDVKPRAGAPLRIALVLPRPTTDAWLLWGRDDGDRVRIESTDRHLIKRKIFPQRYATVDRARELAPTMLTRLESGELPPPSLAAALADIQKRLAPPSADALVAGPG